MPWPLVAYFVFAFLVVVCISWPMISSAWWDLNLHWIESDEKRLNFFTREDPRLERVLNEVRRRAEEKNFPAIEVKIRLVRRMVHSTALGTAHDLPPRIYIFEWLTKDYSDEDLTMLIAHEFGHIVDMKTKRTGHPVFSLIKRYDSEKFAHYIAAYLYSKEQLLGFIRRCCYVPQPAGVVENLDIL